MFRWDVPWFGRFWGPKGQSNAEFLCSPFRFVFSGLWRDFQRTPCRRLQPVTHVAITASSNRSALAFTKLE